MAPIYNRPMSLMERLRKATGFDWDSGNSGKNWKSHEVSDGECEQVFFNRPLVIAPDERHSTQEARHYCLGTTDGGRRLFVAFTVRNRLIRPICFRDMSRKERKEYSSHG